MKVRWNLIHFGDHFPEMRYIFPNFIHNDKILMHYKYFHITHKNKFSSLKFSSEAEIPTFIAQQGEEVVLSCPVNTAGEIITFQTFKYFWQGWNIFTNRWRQIPWRRKTNRYFQLLNWTLSHYRLWRVSLSKMVSELQQSLRLLPIRSVQQCRGLLDG